MHRLLIVDDEPYTVDGLHEMLQEADLPEMDLYRAYSAIEAIEWLNRVKIDLVLSDIRMPGMDGLRLLKEIRSRWPRCKVIFLTGMNEMSYVRQALRDGSIDYILKTEGDEPIVRAIGSAIEALQEEWRRDQFVLDAQARVRQAMPTLRNDWFRRLLLHGAEDAGLSAARLAELECPLDADAKLLPVLARVDRWPEEMNGSDRTLLQFAFENIMAELLDGAKLQTVFVDEHYTMLLLQRPDGSEPSGPFRDEEAMAGYVTGTLETAQSICTRLLRLPVSVICSLAFVSWDELAVTYYRMRRKLVVGIGQGENMQLLSCGGGGPRPIGERLPTLLSRQRERLDIALESGRLEEAADAISSAIGHSGEYAHYLEAYYTVANLMIGLVNRSGWDSLLAEDNRMERLMDAKSHPTREQAVSYLQETAERLIAFKRDVQEERTVRIVDRVNLHIRENIGGDLSLTALAELVYLNPAYLSVLYKQTTGQNLSDYIAGVRLEKAKELLQHSPLKIHELAAAVGFDNAGYFTRFFRKRTGLGPLEYREQAGR
ncbi:response regulator [Cohnella sp.]|uniref:response regulator n=1 Tax=Cohnella sp. TaxID=1883426 RepID=UPI0035640409